MKSMPLKLMDLVPKETQFKLSDYPDKEFTMGRWTLRVRQWATDKYTPKGIERIFKTQQINEIADIAYFMLAEKDKKEFFKTKDEFLEHVVTIQDQVNVIMALLAGVGIGEPEIEKLNQALQKDNEGEESPNEISPNL